MGLVGACKTQHLPHPPAHTFLRLPPPSFGSLQLAPICASDCWLFWLYPQGSSSNTVPKSSLKPQEPQLPWDILAPSSRKQTRHLSKYSPQNKRLFILCLQGKEISLSLSWGWHIHEWFYFKPYYQFQSILDTYCDHKTTASSPLLAILRKVRLSFLLESACLLPPKEETRTTVSEPSLELSLPFSLCLTQTRRPPPIVAKIAHVFPILLSQSS